MAVDRRAEGAAVKAIANLARGEGVPRSLPAVTVVNTARSSVARLAAPLAHDPSPFEDGFRQEIINYS
jgi:hypothetical protein